MVVTNFLAGVLSAAALFATTVSAQAVITPACLYLDTDSICGPAFAGYPIFIKNQKTVPNVATLNATIQKLSNSADIAKLLMKPSSEKGLGCTPNAALANDAAASLRYQASVYCSALVAETLLVTSCRPDLARTAKVNPAVLCAPQCKIAATSAMNLLQNTTVCPPADPAAMGNRAILTNVYALFHADYPSYCDYSRQQDQSTCYDGIPSEGGKLCGYSNSAVAASQCAINTADPCCRSLLGTVTDDADSSSNRTIIIAVVIVLVVLLCFGIGVCLCCRGRRNRTSKSRTGAFSNSGYSKHGSFNIAPPVPPIPANYTHQQNTSTDKNGQDNTAYHGTRVLSPEFRDSWGSAAQHIPKAPSAAYQTDIAMAPISSVSNPNYARSSPSVPQHQHSFSSDPYVTQGMGNPFNPDLSAPYVPMAAPPRGDLQGAKNISTPWDAPVVTPKPAPISQASEQAPESGSAEDDDLLNIPMRVLHQYVPTLADELPLQAGSEIVMVRCFDDGWALGVIPATGQTGAFPLVCVARMDAVPQAVAPVVQGGSGNAGPQSQDGAMVDISKRVSSQQYLSKMDLSRLAHLGGGEGMRRSMGGNLRSSTQVPADVPAQIQPSQAPVMSTIKTPMPHDSFGQLPRKPEEAHAAPPAFEQQMQPFVVGTDGDDDHYDTTQDTTPATSSSLTIIPPPRVKVPPTESAKLSPTSSNGDVAAGPFGDENRIDTASVVENTTEEPSKPANELQHTLPDLQIGSIGLDIATPSAGLDDYYNNALDVAEVDQNDDKNPFKSS
ncbi:hypothetical protein DFJ77DRAFT_544964 [Powellomyces hirtus]|nr:hypothetical protein DFJ77DRAFT_544964 [Powellomyces hirtus]